MQLQYHKYKWQAKNWKGEVPKNWRAWKLAPHKEIDEWGVIWEEVGDGTMGWPVEGPLKHWDDIDKIVLPDGSDPARYSMIRKINKLLPRKSKYRLGLIDNFLFERTHFLRGWDNYMRDLVKSQNQIKSLIKHIFPYYEAMITQLHDMGAQAVFTTDDWGSQEDVFISPRTFDSVFMDAYKKIINLCHDLGMAFILHSCGNIGKFIPKFIECGVDALELDSPRMTGLETLAKYSGKIAYLVTVDIQTVYPNGSPADVRKEVKSMIDILADYDGGMIAIGYAGAHDVLKVPKANIKMFPKVIKSCGQYLSNGKIDRTRWD
jgi:uroporphyrinogen decarboxylase